MQGKGSLEPSGANVFKWTYYRQVLCSGKQRNLERSLKMNFKDFFPTHSTVCLAKDLRNVWRLISAKPPFRKLRSCCCKFQLRYFGGGRGEGGRLVRHFKKWANPILAYSLIYIYIYI